MPDLDGFIALNDAQIRSNESQASIADKLAGIPQKLAQADLTEQQAIHQHLENVAKWLDIQWDAQAHEHLLTMRNVALQNARETRRETDKLRHSIGHVTALMAGGGDWTAIRDGWVALAYVRQRLPLEVSLKAVQVPTDESAYSRDSWKHPTHDVPPIMPASRDPGSLLDWARQNTCYPKWGSAAAALVGNYLQALAAAATAEAAALQDQQESAENSAIELCKLDWERLKAA